MKRYIYNAADEYMAADEVRRVQAALLREHLNYCRNTSPYYQTLFKNMDFTDFNLDDLKRLPFTDKHDFSFQNDDFIAVDNKQIADIVFSSGTTGRPCKVAYSDDDLKRLAYNEENAFARCGITAEDNVLLTCTIDRCFVAGLAYYLGIRKIGAGAIRNGLNSFASHARIIEDLSPTVVVGVPSFLRKLGISIKQSGGTLDCVKKLICIGEPVRKQDLSYLPVAEELESIWQAQLYSTYASSETITTFAECDAGTGSHYSHDLGIFEIVDDVGNVLPPGQVGELVVTPLQMTGTPLVRFKTGDLSFMLDGKCECGRTGMRLGPILGRKSQMLKVNGTTIFPQVIFSELAVIPEIDEYYIEVYGKNLADEVKVFVTLQNKNISLAEISDCINAVTRVSLKVSEVSRNTALNKIFSADSRKPKRFFDLRQQTTLKI